MNRIKFSLFTLVAIIVCMLILYSCYNKNSRSPDIRNTGRSLLLNDEREELFGMYTYILFKRPPNESSEERYMATIDAFLSYQVISEYQGYISSDSLNVIYLPINKISSSTNPDSLLTHYNYTRANVILSTIPDSVSIGLDRPGPFIVSSLEPLTNKQEISNPYLIQDLSTVPPHIIHIWIDEFVNEAQEPKTWNGSTIESLVLNLRTNIARAAEGWPVVETAVINFVKFFY